jgi:hypothetical protein
LEYVALTQSETYRVGDWAEVRPLDEIIATLDPHARLDALPFMPEMARLCGKRLMVVKSAHKTCDPTGSTNLRRLERTVHLKARCDGSGHDGCQARCLIYWKTDWLKKVDGPGPDTPVAPPTEEQMAFLAAQTRRTVEGDETPRYACQATDVVFASKEIHPRELGQYVEDMRTGNVGLFKFVWYVGDLILWSLFSRYAKALGFSKSEEKPANPAAKAKKTEVLNLEVGEYVQVRPAAEILGTLDSERKNFGLFFDREMEQFCGKTYRVTGKLKTIIDERTGKMIRFGNPVIVLDELQCGGLVHRGRLFCPRSPLWFWREGWLRRAPAKS